MVRYLTRYLTGGPISDSRIVAADEQTVTFMAREGKQTGGQREQVPVTIETMEFVRRWCEHIQPEQLTKTRYFGGWCSRKRRQYQSRCRELLGLSLEPETSQAEKDEAEKGCDSAESVSTSESENDSGPQCQACESRSLRLVGLTAKPSWSTVLSQFDSRCPSWYAEQEYKELCEQLEREYGISYEDWCLEMRIESPMREPLERPAGPPHPPQQFHQLHLPRLSPERVFAIESY